MISLFFLSHCPVEDTPVLEVTSCLRVCLAEFKRVLRLGHVTRQCFESTSHEYLIFMSVFYHDVNFWIFGESSSQVELLESLLWVRAEGPAPEGGFCLFLKL